jgi:branched-chain amino acid transport system permease protein
MINYLCHILVQACITSSLAVSLNLLAGYCGLVSLGQLVFFAIGAYSAALIAPATPFGYLLAFPAAFVLATVGAIIQAAATANLKEDEYAVATFAIQAIFWMLLMNWVALTRGPMGIPGVPPFEVFGFAADGPVGFLPVALMLLGASLAATRRLTLGNFGMAMAMLRDDEALASGFGRNVRSLRRSVTVVAATIAAMAGICYASYVGYINPVTFSSMESTLLLAVVIVGGLGTFWGPVIGASIFTFLPEVFSFIGFPTSVAANVRQVLLGIILIAVVFRARISKHQSLFKTGREQQ